MGSRKGGEEGAWLQARDQLKQGGSEPIPLAFLPYVCPEIVPNQNPEGLKAMNLTWGSVWQGWSKRPQSELVTHH